MPIPPRAAPPTPTRSFRRFTLGTGPATPALSTTAAAPNLSTLTATPPTVNVLGVAAASAQLALPALAAGARQSLSVTVPLPLPSLLAAPPGEPASARAQLETRAGDRVLFQATTIVGGLPAGLVLVGTTTVPQARAGAQIYLGPVLPGGQAYTSFAIVCTITVTASAATNAGSVGVTANGTLTLQSG